MKFSRDNPPRIVQSAYELHYRQRCAQASVDVIARKSGLTKRTLYYLFRSKDDLLASVFEFHRGLALKRITDWAGTLLGGLDRVLDGLFANQPGRAEPAPASPASWS